MVKQNQISRNVHRKYRIKSKFRFITSLVIALGLFVGLFGFITGIDTTTAVTKNDCTEIEVCAGDTLWDIANTYCSVEYRDHQEYIDEVMRLNHLTSYDIHSGNYLILPYYGSKPL